MKTVVETRIGEYQLHHRGKVRDVYAVDAETLLMVTTDRISAFDVVLPEPVPGKGIVLNQITLFWMDMMADLVPNHIVASDVADFPAELQKYADDLQGRAVLVKKTQPLPIECIVRGYITGSGMNDYMKTGAVCGHVLPPNLLESAPLPGPLFTPSTKAELGAHDENISVEQARKLAGEDVAAKAQELSLAIYSRARDFAKDKGIIIADTKFEFGMLDGEMVLIDEVLTPDSSRFWPADSYKPGRSQPSFDKQFVRDYLKSVNYTGDGEPPHLPEEIVQKTAEKYLDAYRRLTGKELNL